MTAVPARDAGRRGTVPAVFGAGVAAALQVGKAAIATPLLEADLGLDLLSIGWLTAVFAILGAVGGIPAGAVVSRFGDRNVAVLGLAAVAAGATLGALASSHAELLASRIVEGLGFLLVTVAGPAILQRTVEEGRRDPAFAVWSCFMPAGMALAMLAGPLFTDWRAIWWASGGLALAAAAALLSAVPAPSPDQHLSLREFGGRVREAMRGGPVLLAAIFALYSLMFFALFSFLPVLLMERMEVTHRVAGLLSALAVAANILGNLAAGYLLSRGVGRPVLAGAAVLVIGLAGLGIFLPVLPDVPAFLLCVLFSAVGGLIPATLLSTAPVVAPAAGLTPIVVGLVMQGSNLGQIVGPVAVGGVIEVHGWPAGAGVVGLAAVLALAMAWPLGRVLRRGP
jgi:predicted MFS family arabinose efflux permease